MNDKLDEMIKLERLLSIIKESAERELKDFEAIVHQELEDARKKAEEEFNEKLRSIEEEKKRKLAELEKLHSSRKELLLFQKRSQLKAEISAALREAVRKLLEKLEGEERKRFLKMVFEMAKERMGEGDFKVGCRKEDVEIVREFFDGEVVEMDLSGGVVLMSGRMRVIADIESFLDEIQDLINEIAEEKAGDLR